MKKKIYLSLFLCSGLSGQQLQKYIFEDTLSSKKNTYEMLVTYAQDSSFEMNIFHQPYQFKKQQGQWLIKQGKKWPVFFDAGKPVKFILNQDPPNFKKRGLVKNYKNGTQSVIEYHHLTFAMDWQLTALKNHQNKAIYTVCQKPVGGYWRTGLGLYYFTFEDGIIAYNPGGCGLSRFYIRQDKRDLMINTLNKK
jgi:hypothetical protein